MNTLPIPSSESILYEDAKLYFCLAKYPLTCGHTIVAWKAPASDLHLLDRADYLYLMEKVDLMRNALLKVLSVEKVYLLYMDEVKQVHWHLIPRYNEKGYNLLLHEPQVLTDFSLAAVLKKALK